MFKIADISGKKIYSSEIFSLEKTCFPAEYWSCDSIQKSLEKQNTICLACIYEEKVIAYITACRLLDEAELERVAVLPEYRGQGIGKKLINELVNILSKYGVAKLMLEVRMKNLNAIALYKRCGFTEDTVRKNYYINPNDDALLMSLII